MHPIIILYPKIFPPQRTITALNGLQTNAAVLEEIRKSGEMGSRRPTRFAQMPRDLRRVGLEVSGAGEGGV